MDCFRGRALAFVIDIIVFMIAFVLVNIIPFYDDYILLSSDLEEKYYIFYVISLLVISILFLGKDLIRGQSFGKKIAKIRVVVKGKGRLYVFRLLLRNITIFIWPIELVLLLLGKQKIGNVLAKTDIVLCAD